MADYLRKNIRSLWVDFSSGMAQSNDLDLDLDLNIDLGFHTNHGTN